MNNEFKIQFDKYFAGCQQIYNDYHKRMGFHEGMKNQFEYKAGRRYVKVIAVMSGNQRSVHSFVDMKEGASYGAVLKAAGWAKPAKHARGNVFDKNDGLGMMGEYGPAYLR
jgi:hypothetical protein